MNTESLHDIFFHTFFPILIIIGMILWFYCLWFYNKYDRNTNRLIMLLVLNFYYVPFYLFRIKQIKNEHRIKAISEEIYDSDFLNLSRLGIIDSLKQWTLKYEIPKAKISQDEDTITVDLFERWEDFYRIDFKIIDEAFTESEQELLKSFDKTLSICKQKLKGDYPSFSEFQKTNDWSVLNRLAIEIINEIK